MTNTPSSWERHREPSPLTCADVAMHLPAYLAGTLPTDASRAIEWHAAHCNTCEPLLLDGAHAPSLGPEAVAALAQQGALAAHEADQLRRVTLDRVHRLPRRPRLLNRPARWLVPVGTLLAASLLLLLTRDNASARRSQLEAAGDSETDSSWIAFPGASTAPMRSALQLAQQQAAPEFEALDTARREIDRAIAAAPTDEALRDFRDAIDARRRELESRVARVTE